MTEKLAPFEDAGSPNVSVEWLLSMMMGKPERLDFFQRH
jgi:hypothetical protein